MDNKARGQLLSNSNHMKREIGPFRPRLASSTQAAHITQHISKSATNSPDSCRRNKFINLTPSARQSQTEPPSSPNTTARKYRSKAEEWDASISTPKHASSTIRHLVSATSPGRSTETRSRDCEQIGGIRSRLAESAGRSVSFHVRSWCQPRSTSLLTWTTAMASWSVTNQKQFFELFAD